MTGYVIGYHSNIVITGYVIGYHSNIVITGYVIGYHSNIVITGYVIVSPVRSTYGGYYGLVVVTPRPRPRPHFIVYAITLKNLIGLLPILYVD